METITYFNWLTNNTNTCCNTKVDSLWAEEFERFLPCIWCLPGVHHLVWGQQEPQGSGHWELCPVPGCSWAGTLAEYHSHRGHLGMGQVSQRLHLSPVARPSWITLPEIIPFLNCLESPQSLRMLNAGKSKKQKKIQYINKLFSSKMLLFFL